MALYAPLITGSTRGLEKRISYVLCKNVNGGLKSTMVGKVSCICFSRDSTRGSRERLSSPLVTQLGQRKVTLCGRAQHAGHTSGMTARPWWQTSRRYVSFNWLRRRVQDNFQEWKQVKQMPKYSMMSTMLIERVFGTTFANDFGVGFRRSAAALHHRIWGA